MFHNSLSQQYKAQAAHLSVQSALKELTESKDKRVHSEALLVLSSALYETGSTLVSFHEPLVDVLSSIVLKQSSLSRKAVICLGNLCVKTGPKFHSLHLSVSQIFLKTLNSCNDAVKSSIFRSFELIINENKSVVPVIVDGLAPCLVSTVCQFNRKVFNCAESDFSDNETRKNKALETLHLNALLCIQAILKADVKNHQLPKMLLEPPNMTPIYDLIHEQMDEELKKQLSMTLVMIFEKSKTQFAAAENMNDHDSFTSFSSKLASILIAAHRSLLRSFVKSNAFSKALLSLIKITPYDRLQPDLRGLVYQALCKHEFTVVDIECLTALIQSKFDPWIDNADFLDFVFGKFQGASKGVIIHLFDCLAALSTHQPQKLMQHLDQIEKTIEPFYKDPNSDVRCAVAKFLEQSGKVFIEHTIPFSWWTRVFTNLLVFTSDISYIIRGLSITALGYIPNDFIVSLTEQQRACFMATFVTLLHDSESQVRASACGAVGSIMSCIFIQDYPLFIMDVAQTLVTLCKDEALAVRIRASWALGNTTESLAKQSPPETLIVNILLVSVDQAKDNEKCRAHACRIIAHGIRLMSPELLSQEKDRLVKLSIEALLYNMKTGSFKNKWNACHALSIVLSLVKSPYWIDDVIDSILSSLDSPNFKVRINAMSALSSFTSENDYVSNQCTAQQNHEKCKQKVTRLLTSLEKMDIEFNEYKYKEQLIGAIQTYLT